MNTPFNNGEIWWPGTRPQQVGVFIMPDVTETPQKSPYDFLNEIPCLEHQPAKELTTPPWIVQDLIKPKQIITINAPYGAGATWFSLALALGITGEGAIFSKFKSINPTGVLYFEGSMTAETLGGRAASLRTDASSNPFKLISSDQIPGHGMPNFAETSWQNNVTKFLEENRQFGVVFFDNNISLSQAEIEEDDWPEIESWLLKIRKQGVTQVWVTSDPKHGIVIPPKLIDLSLKLTRDEDFDHLVLRTDYLKSRSVRKDLQGTFYVELVTNEIGRKTMTCRRCAEHDRLLAIYQASIGYTQKAIAKGIDKSQATISRYLEDAEQSGWIRREGHRCILTEQGKQILINQSITNN